MLVLKISDVKKKLNFVSEIILPNCEVVHDELIESFLRFYPENEYKGIYYPAGFYKGHDIRRRKRFYLNEDLKIFSLRRKYGHNTIEKERFALNSKNKDYFEELELAEQDRKKVFSKFLDNMDLNKSNAKKIKNNLEVLLFVETAKENLHNYESNPLILLDKDLVNVFRSDLRPYLIKFENSVKVLSYFNDRISSEIPEENKVNIYERLNMYKDIKNIVKTIGIIKKLHNYKKQIKLPELNNTFVKDLERFLSTQSHKHIQASRKIPDTQGFNSSQFYNSNIAQKYVS